MGGDLQPHSPISPSITSEETWTPVYNSLPVWAVQQLVTCKSPVNQSVIKIKKLCSWGNLVAPCGTLFSNELACLRLVGTGTSRQSLAYTCGYDSWKWEAETKPQQRNLKAENLSNRWRLGPFIISTDISFVIYLGALNACQRLQNV